MHFRHFLFLREGRWQDVKTYIISQLQIIGPDEVNGLEDT